LGVLFLEVGVALGAPTTLGLAEGLAALDSSVILE
jgi:hypothetical protein